MKVILEIRERAGSQRAKSNWTHSGVRCPDSVSYHCKPWSVSNEALHFVHHRQHRPINLLYQMKNAHEYEIFRFNFFHFFILSLLDDAAQRSLLIDQATQQSLAMVRLTRFGIVGMGHAPNVHLCFDETIVSFHSRRNRSRLRCCVSSNPSGMTALKSMASIPRSHIAALWRTGDLMC